MESQITKFKNYFNNLIDEYKNVCERNTKITLRDIFYYLNSLISSSKKSSTNVVTEMKIHKLTKATNKAFIKKRHTISSKIFKNISDSLMNYYYENFESKTYKGYIIYAGDGTDSSLTKKLSNEGYKLTKNKTYCSVLVHGIYDCSNQMLIDLKLSKKKDEREIFKLQFEYIGRKCIITLDRGYCGDKQMSDMHKNGLKFIVRLRENFKFLNNFKNTDIDDEFLYKLKGTKDKIRIVKYIHENKK